MADDIELTIDARPRDLGGFSVRRVLPYAKRRMVGPFIFFDHMGPVSFPPGQGVDVRPHPHIGLATVTYLFEGELMHRDSLGVEQPIRPGDVNWMTAGRGIVHSERTAPDQRAQGAHLHGIQAWVALPLHAEDTEPSFHHHPAPTLPDISRHGVNLRLIAGHAFGQHAPVATYSDLFYLDALFTADAALELPPEYTEQAFYVVEGAASVGDRRFGPGTLVLLKPERVVTVQAGAGTRLMLLGGEPLEGERHIWWNFVSSSPERIEQAKDDWAAGRFAPVPGESESIPLPAA